MDNKNLEYIKRIIKEIDFLCNKKHIEEIHRASDKDKSKVSSFFDELCLSINEETKITSEDRERILYDLTLCSLCLIEDFKIIED